MSQPWRILSMAAVVAVLLVSFIHGGLKQPLPASAADCTQDKTGTLVIEIIDRATDDLLSVGGSKVLINPDPRDFDLDHIVVDSDLTDANAAEDRDQDPGVIRIETACSTQGSESYTAILFGLPIGLEDCEIEVGSDTGQLAAGATRKLTLEVDCTGIVPTPTPVATATPALPATVTASTSPLSVSCNGTSIVSIQVRDALGNPVKPGTAVALSTTLGALSPSSGHVTNDAGMVFAFLTAPATSDGTATILATAGSASGTAFVTVSCGAPAATAPPGPTGTVAGVITPPNTGDAGLAASNHGSSALLGILATTSMAVGLAVLARVRWSRRVRA